MVPTVATHLLLEEIAVPCIGAQYGITLDRWISTIALLAEALDPLDCICPGDIAYVLARREHLGLVDDYRERSKFLALRLEAHALLVGAHGGLRGQVRKRSFSLHEIDRL